MGTCESVSAPELEAEWSISESLLVEGGGTEERANTECPKTLAATETKEKEMIRHVPGRRNI